MLLKQQQQISLLSWHQLILPLCASHAPTQMLLPHHYTFSSTYNKHVLYTCGEAGVLHLSCWCTLAPSTCYTRIPRLSLWRWEPRARRCQLTG